MFYYVVLWYWVTLLHFKTWFGNLLVFIGFFIVYFLLMRNMLCSFLGTKVRHKLYSIEIFIFLGQKLGDVLALWLILVRWKMQPWTAPGCKMSSAPWTASFSCLRFGCPEKSTSGRPRLPSQLRCKFRGIYMYFWQGSCAWHCVWNSSYLLQLLRVPLDSVSRPNKLLMS